MSCRVRGCRYPSTHTTAAHRCGTCSHAGHGQLECGRATRMEALRRFYHERLARDEDFCTHVGCQAPWSHTTAAHHCGTCGRLSTTCTCGAMYKIACPLCKAVSDVDVDKTVFTDGECCVCYDRRPMVVFPSCRHAKVCADCAARL